MTDHTGEVTVDRDTMAKAKASFDRCCRSPKFIDDFYATFFRRCPEAKPLFANTDWDRQKKLLRHAIGLLLVFPAHADEEPNILARVAERHSRRDLNVDPALYTPFVDSLMHTVAEHDPQFSTEIGAAWQTTIAKGIAYMQSKY